MTLCSYGHDEVCYDSRKCPVCEKQKEVDDLTSQLKDANYTADQLREEVKSLEKDEVVK